MKNPVLSKSFALLLPLLLVATAASAAPRAPVLSCAIIHAVYLAKKAQSEDGAVATYCRKFVPGKLDRNGNDVNLILKNRLSTSVARRQNSLGVSSNNKVGRLKNADGTVLGDANCDPNVQSELPKRSDITAAEIAAFLDTALNFCDERT